MKPERSTLYGVAVVCFANLLLEVVLTRIYSATMFYHFTFLAIALALFGLAASGVYVYVREDELARASLPAEMARNARRFAGATILLLVYALANPVEMLVGEGGAPTLTNQALLKLSLLVGFSALPFFFSGMVVSLAVTFYRQDINRLYFFDLVGAALAALLAGVLLALLGGPSLVIAIAVLSAAAAFAFERHGARGAGTLVVLGALLVFNLATGFIGVPSTKLETSAKVRFEGWNVFSRVTVDKTNEIRIDSSASTTIHSLAEVGGGRPIGEISALAHALFPQGEERTLVIGPGGGRDVVHALSSGSRHVTAVEINPLIARSIMSERFADANGHLYTDPRVHLVVGDGRSYVRATDERFDLIQASLVDTWAATAAGAFALTENTLYTVEAFEDYYGHLTANGAVTMTRWHTGAGSETARLLLLASGTLERLGVPAHQTRQHLFYAVGGQLGSLIAKRSAFTDEELARLEAACAAGGFQVVLSPRTPAADPLATLVDAGAWSATVRAQHDELRPPTDDRPFFFFFAKPERMWTLEGRLHGKMDDPTLWMLISLLMVGALTLSCVLVPLIAKGLPPLPPGDAAPWYRRPLVLGYFALLGLAFIVVEMAMLQKFTVFLGHPSYSLLVVLFSVLTATAAGARVAGRFAEARLGRTLLGCGAVLAILMAGYSFTLGPGLRSLVGLSLPVRVALAAALLAVPGCLMGMMLPSGVRLMDRKDAALVPWAWGLNGATSVIGTVAATVIAIYVGFAGTLLLGALGYLIAAAGVYGYARITAA